MTIRKAIANPITVFINVIGLILVIYDIFYLGKIDDGLYGKTFFFGMYFVFSLYIVTFIHLFWYQSLGNKILITLVDLTPIVVLSLVVGITEPYARIQDVIPFFMIFYIGASAVIVITNLLVEKLIKKRFTKK